MMLSMLPILTWAQDHELKSTVDIYRDIQELQRGLRVLYLAAHPDDENTRLISWLENDQHARTAYLSLTRGQGGQNLIGDEKGDGLGVIRSYELLGARSIDGGEQFFTRAIDFGYSKSAEESFEFWGKEDILHDVVYVIRKYRPHVIVTRFPPTRRAGHGHHEASAILAEEAFDLAADETAFPEQLNALGTWQATSLYHNTSSWWDKSLTDMTDEQLAEKKMFRVNIGVYNDLLGQGMNEIASLARSNHRCQAFGTPRRRGEQFEYLQHVKGDWSPDVFSSHPGVWQRSPEHSKGLQAFVEAFDFTDRSENMNAFRKLVLPLIAQRSMWAESQDMQEILMQVNDLKLDMSGMRVEVFAGQDPVVAGKEYSVQIEVYNSGQQVQEVTFKHEVIDTSFSIGKGEQVTFERTLTAPGDPSNPFWLKNGHGGWLYEIDKATEIGLPKSNAEAVQYMIKVDGQWVLGSTEVHRRWTDRSIGGIEQPLVVVPSVTITPAVQSKVILPGSEFELEVSVKAFEDVSSLMIEAILPKGIEMIKASWPSFMSKGQERNVLLELRAGKSVESGAVKFIAKRGDDTGESFEQTPIIYEHIPHVYIHTESSVELMPLDLEMTEGKKLLYIEGSGDEVDEALVELGYSVDKRSFSELSKEELSAYDAVITGIRAFNRNAELAANEELLNEYVKEGGRLIVQYNTTYDLKVEHPGPIPFKLSRERVTDEVSEVKVMEPKHPVFNQPNKILSDDWENWVQERGLYFAGEWDKAYKPLIAWADKGEEEALGGLIIGEYGKGTVIYTGISFFRQLPAGVHGAYKLFVNLIEH